MTACVKKIQGFGLGKCLKAAMFKKLTQDFPTLETIKTDAGILDLPSIRLSKK